MAEQVFTVTGLTDMISETRRLNEPPSFRTISEFEAILAEQFAQSQTLVHVITGSLKLSGKTSSDFDGNEWVGEISYGGPSAGPISNVRYAQAEAARHGTHSAFLDCFWDEKYTRQYREALVKHFRGDA